MDHENFFKNRAAYLSQAHPITEQEYYDKSTSQFEEMKSIPVGSTINLWFEDDLFCQCNLWFVIDLLLSIPLKANIYLVRPNSNSWKGFGAMSRDQFAQAYKNRTLLNETKLATFKNLWQIYTKQLNGDLKTVSSTLTTLIPQIEKVIDAHLDRQAPKNRPLQSLKNIISESEDKSFSAVFKKFSEQEGIYGFGDTSIKKMYDELIKQD